MGNGFLNNLPDLGLSPAKRKKKKKTVPVSVPETKNIERKTEVVIWHTVQCPRCKSEKVPVITTRKPIRYHKCENCGHHFKSVEV